MALGYHHGPRWCPSLQEPQTSAQALRCFRAPNQDVVLGNSPGLGWQADHSYQLALPPTSLLHSSQPVNSSVWPSFLPSYPTLTHRNALLMPGKRWLSNRWHLVESCPPQPQGMVQRCCFLSITRVPGPRNHGLCIILTTDIWCQRLLHRCSPLLTSRL